jgi:hypothetical protein
VARNQLARTYAGLARLLQRTADAGGDFKKAQELYGQLSREDPNNQRLSRESASLASFATSTPDVRPKRLFCEQN